jgi:NAD(P)-dependent dehydrogenase (short-subunit alcohol dehydrogenase family)
MMGIAMKNKVALVTGANRGIGKAIVETFLARGAGKVYLAVRNPASTRELETKYGSKVATIQADLSDADSIKRLAEATGDVEIIVNNAGVLVPSLPVSDLAEQALAKELDVNVFGLLRMANAFADTLERNKGAFVQLNSVGSLKNFLPLSTYSASKAASYSLTQGLYWQWKEKGIAVLSVHPGPVMTDMAAEAGFDEGATSPEIIAEGIVEALEAGAFHLFPDDMAKQFELVYKDFAEHIVMQNLAE